MSRKPRNVAPVELVSVPPIVVDKAHMICIRSADGHHFLVDRNCALVSGVFSRAMRKRGVAGGSGVCTPIVPPLENEEQLPEDQQLQQKPIIATRIGNEVYETILAEGVSKALMELALQAMHFKYRYDGEPEKRPMEPQYSIEDSQKLAALSILLDM